MTKLPSVMVLVYEPALTHSNWEDVVHHCRTLNGLVRFLRKGVRDGNWIAYRFLTIHGECTGNVSEAIARRAAEGGG